MKLAFPQLGKTAPLCPEALDIRDATFGSYVVRYAVQAHSVIVLRIWHHYGNR